MIRPGSQFMIIQSDELFVYDRSMAVIAFWSISLKRKIFLMSTIEQRPELSTHLVIIKMAVRSPIFFVRAQVLQEFITDTTPETTRVPPGSHSTHDSPNNRAPAPPTRQSTTPTHRLCGHNLTRLYRLVPQGYSGNRRISGLHRYLWCIHVCHVDGYHRAIIFVRLRVYFSRIDRKRYLGYRISLGRHIGSSNRRHRRSWWTM
jgi:hypothetical protein